MRRLVENNWKKKGSCAERGLSVSGSQPGGEGLIPGIVRFWWVLINNYHFYRWLIAQTVTARRAFLPRNEKRRGETAVITGGSRGIGAAVVKRLLQCDMHVIIGCRDRVATNNFVKALRRKGVTSGTVEAISLDLSSINSVKEFVYKIIKKDVLITALINNAGVKSSSYNLTVDGLEEHFQVNYLSHVLLTYMLLPKLHSSGQGQGQGKCARVINVSTLEHYGAYPDLSDSQMINFYSPEKAYMDTKLMLGAWSAFLDRKLQELGASVRSFTVHPGFVSNQRKEDKYFGWIDKFGIVNRLFFERHDSAANSIVYAALSPTLEGTGGLFLHNTDVSLPHPLCDDRKFQAQLWALTKNTLRLEDNILSEEVEDDVSDEEEISERLDKRNQNIDTDSDLEHHLQFLEYDLTSRSSCEETFGNLLPEIQKSSWKYSFNLNFKILKIFSIFEEQVPQKKGRNCRRRPYYEYFITNIFQSCNSTSRVLKYLENVSLFLLRRLDRINSQFKLVQAFVRSE